MTPILVEWLYRGILQPTLAQRVDSSAAILLTAVVAAFLQGGVLELCQNVLWGWASAGRRSLLVSVVAHGLYAAWLLGRLYAG